MVLSMIAGRKWKEGKAKTPFFPLLSEAPGKKGIAFVHYESLVFYIEKEKFSYHI